MHVKKPSDYKHLQNIKTSYLQAVTYKKILLKISKSDKKN